MTLSSLSYATRVSLSKIIQNMVKTSDSYTELISIGHFHRKLNMSKVELTHQKGHVQLEEEDHRHQRLLLAADLMPLLVLEVLELS